MRGCLQTRHLLTLFLNHPVQVVVVLRQGAVLLLQLRDHLHTRTERTQQPLIKSIDQGECHHLEHKHISIIQDESKK